MTASKSPSERWVLYAAVIAGMAGVLGALAGGAVTYLGNKELQADQSRSAARGIARVYQGEFLSFDNRLRAMLKSGVYLSALNQPFVLSLDDRKLLASNVSGDEWVTIEDAEAGLRIFDNPNDVVVKKALAGLAPALDRVHRQYIQDNHRAAVNAIAALAPLAGVNPLRTS